MESIQEMIGELNEREQEIALLLSEGLNRMAIAEKLELTTRTVRHNMESIKEKCKHHKAEFIDLVESIEDFELDLEALRNGNEVEINPHTYKNGRETAKDGRLRIKRWCAICGRDLFVGDKSSTSNSGELPNAICDPCKEEHELPEMREDYPDWVLALIAIESKNYEKARNSDGFVTSFVDERLDMDATPKSD